MTSSPSRVLRRSRSRARARAAGSCAVSASVEALEPRSRAVRSRAGGRRWRRRQHLGARARSPRSSPPRAAARSRAARAARWCSSRRWRATCSPGARASRASARARSATARRPWRASAPPRPSASRASPHVAAAPRPRRRASASSSSRRRRRRAACGRCGGRRTRSPARAAARPSGTASRRRTRRGRRASRRRGRRSTTSTSPTPARSCSARAIAGAAWRSWTGANAQTRRPAQPRRRSAGEHVVARLAALAGDDADRARQRRPRQRLLRREQALGVEPPAQHARAARAGRPRRRGAGR